MALDQFNKSRLIRLDSDHYTSKYNGVYKFYLHSSDEATHEVSRVVLKSMTIFNVQSNVSANSNRLDLSYNGVLYAVVVPAAQYSDIDALRLALQTQINSVVGPNTITFTVDSEGVRLIVSTNATLILFISSTIASIIGLATANKTILVGVPQTLTFIDLNGVGEILIKSPELAFGNMIHSDHTGQGFGTEEAVFTTILFGGSYGSRILFNSPHHRASDILYKVPRDLRMISIFFEDERTGEELELHDTPWSIVLQIYY
jgi:hypothetical protein